MSAPVISLIATTDTPNEGRVKINAGLTSLKDNTVWLDPASAQNGSFWLVSGLLSSHLAIGSAPATTGAVRLENTAEIRWAYGGTDTWRMRNNGNAWDLSINAGGTWYPVFSIAAAIVGMPYPVSFGAQLTIAEITEPEAPLAGGSIYANGGVLYYKNAAGTVYNLTEVGEAVTMFSRGAGTPDAGTVPDGFIRYDETEKKLKINIGGRWRQI